MNRETVRALFARLRADNPHPTTELVYHSAFELLVAVVLSAQATDKGVNRATAKLFEVAKTPAAILALGEDGLKQHIRTIGLYNSKAANQINTCGIMVQQQHWQVPRDRTSLDAMQGVGRKTANVIMNTDFGEPTIADDTHIFRV